MAGHSRATGLPLRDTLSLFGVFSDPAAVRYPSSHVTELLLGLSEAVIGGGGCCDVSLVLDDGSSLIYPPLGIDEAEPLLRSHVFVVHD